MHLVRNSLDHGLEPPEERRARGKSPAGLVTVTAVRHGSNIQITVGDDGRGLDRNRILAKALEKGLVNPDQGPGLSDDQVYDFIFHPGFSTSTEVSKVSGRGVGMDIVKSMVTASRGSLRIRTKPGEGTSFVMQFPISTAIIDGLVVRVLGNTLIIPVGSVVESLKLPKTAVWRVNGTTEMATIRDENMPVLRLEKVLGLHLKALADLEVGIPPADSRPKEQDDRPFLIGLMVENADHQKFIFIIDEVIAKKEVVVKPLGPRFRHMRGITSGTVLAGGSIGLVIDVDQVIRFDIQGEKP